MKINRHEGLHVCNGIDQLLTELYNTILSSLKYICLINAL